ncbi:MAG: hypothetical protein FH756_06980 [Firmicutes bacterium]|nr:hypothetical protein [Bacillota bacterium]
MKINYIRWNNDRVEHIGRHNITVEEVEEAVYEDRKNLNVIQRKRYTVLSVRPAPVDILRLFLFTRDVVLFIQLRPEI